MAKHIKLIMTAAMGLESVVAEEVRKLGYEVEVDNGKVIFEAQSQPFQGVIFGLERLIGSS